MSMSRIAFGVGLLGLWTAQATAAVVAFEEDFNNPDTTGNLPLTDFGWQAHARPTAVEFPTGTAGHGNAAVSSGDAAGAGFVFYWPGNSNPVDDGIVWTSILPTAFNASDILSIDWDESSNNSGSSWRVALEIGGNWYISNQANPTPGGGGAVWAPQSLAFALDAAEWSELNFQPLSVLTIGSVLASDLPGGEVTAIGLYAQTVSEQTQRFDNFAVTVQLPAETVIPEPTSVGLIIGAGAILLVRRRRLKARRATR